MDNVFQFESKEAFELWIKDLMSKALEASGVTRVDRKHGIFEETTPEDEKNLTKEERFKKWFRGFLNGTVQKTTLVEGSGGGSYTVPLEYANEISAVAGRFGKARQYCRVLTPGSKTLYIPEMTAGITVTVPGENTAYSESVPTLGQKTLTIKAVGAISPMSNELLEDNSVNLLSFISDQFGFAIAKFEDTHTFGSSTSYFSPLCSGLSSATAVTSDASSVVNFSADDLQKLRRSVSEDFWPNAKFFMHPYILSHVESIKDNNGNYIVRQPANSSQPSTIWGHEVVAVSGMPSTDAVSTVYIGFADPKFCYVGTRGEMAIKLLDQATLTTAGNLAEKNLSALRVIERFGQVWTCEAGISTLATHS